MKTNSWRLWHLVTSITLALVLASPMAAKAEANQNLFYMLPMVFAQGWGNESYLPVFDALILGQIGDVLPRRAEANTGDSFARGEASDNEFVAIAVSSGAVSSAAQTRAYMEFVIHDPQSRGLVKVDISSKLSSTSGKGVKGAASVGPPPGLTSYSDAGVRVRVVPASSPFMVSFTDAGKIASLEFPEPPSSAYDLFSAAAQVECGYPNFVTLKCVWLKNTFVNNRLINAEDGDGSRVTLEVFPTFSVVPGLHYVIALEAYTHHDAVAVIDPVLEPHPDNPDIIIEFPNAVADPNPQPLMAGITPDALLAQGIDPQPFIDLGFFDSSPPPPPPAGDTTPPGTLASATPGANANGWNKTPVTVTLGATDNAGGSGVKEVHYSLDGASTASQVISGGTATVTISAEGTTTLTYFAVDNAGNRETAKTLTVRIDRTAPTVTGLPSNCSLWPPDHALVQVASVTARDGLSGLAGASTLTVTSNEPENGTGDGDLAPDVVISGGTVQVRAERAGSGSGRVYTITATASDLAGNTTTQTATCSVPHDSVRTAQP
jgi:hypothetical protein